MGKQVRAIVVIALGLWVVPACKGSEKKTVTGPAPGPGSGAELAASAMKKPRVIPRPAGATLDLAALNQSRRADLDLLAFEPHSDARFCARPSPVDVASIDADRSLFVHDRATLDALGPDTFSLRRTLSKIAGDAVAAGAAGATPEALFRDLWDTQNPGASAATPEGAHCDDDGTTLNGFPNACRPTDGAQAKAPDLATEMATYRPVGLVNRFDLAAEGWKNCGEHRIVYGRVGTGIGGFARSFIIFEAVLPNPRPGCQSGCRPVAEHWYALSSIADPAERARRLEQLFYTGLPGFRPVVHVDHYAAKGASSAYGGAGSGQIRTNQFLEQPWMLKELKLALDCTTAPCKLDAVPIPVKVNPDGNLWTESTEGLAADFQQSVLSQVDKLAVDDLNAFSYEVPLAFDAARSESQTGGIQDHYFEAYSAAAGQPGGFRSQLATQAGVASPGLTDAQIVNRATALSCAGCHQPRTFGLLAASSIGPGRSWPDSAGFVHVRAEAQAGVHALSPALVNEFLPARARNLAAFLGERACFCRFKRPGLDVSRLERGVLPRPPVTTRDLREAEQKLKAQIDRDLVRQGKAKLPDLAPDPKARPLVLEEVRAAGPDPVKQAAARRRAVQKLVGAEPPRKTVTGHFRAH